MSDSFGRNSDPKALQGHTPGPWHVETEPQGCKGQYTQYTIQPRIADVFYMNQTGEANARLIAAAPDLLAALESLYAECAMIHKYDGSACNQKQADKAIKDGLAAIAKARGQA